MEFNSSPGLILTQAVQPGKQKPSPIISSNDRHGQADRETDRRRKARENHSFMRDASDWCLQQSSELSIRKRGFVDSHNSPAALLYSTQARALVGKWKQEPGISIIPSVRGMSALWGWVGGKKNQAVVWLVQVRTRRSSHVQGVSKRGGVNGCGGLHLPTGPKSSVAYGIKSDHKQKHTNKQQKTERGGVKIKTFGVKL